MIIPGCGKGEEDKSNDRAERRERRKAKREDAREKVEAAPAPASTAQKAEVRQAPAARPTQGPANAPVVIVLFSDFQCADCAKLHAMVGKVAARAGDSVLVRYFHLPVSSHPQPEISALASMAAHRQGRFAEMATRLYSDTTNQSRKDILAHARAIGLDMARFERDLADQTLLALVRQGTASAERLGATSTPTMFMNGKRVRTRDVETLLAEIKAERAAAEAFVAKKNGKQPPVRGRPRPTPVPEPPKHVERPARGPASAPVVLVMFSDFQCPYCSIIHDVIEKAAATVGDDVRVEYFHFPLAFHRRAETSAIASMAAHRQGRFAEMATRLYSGMKSQSRQDVLAHARAIGLDMARFERDLKDETLLAFVRQDKAAGSRIGVRGTPTVYLNGRRSKSRDVGTLVAEIAAEKAAVKALVANEGQTVEAARAARVEGPHRDAFIEHVIKRTPLPVSTQPPVWVIPKPKPKPLGKRVAYIPVHPKAISAGPPDALVTIVGCTDFQCPFCRRAVPMLQKARETWPTEVRVAVSHRPLSFHKRARAAAQAAQAAQAQGAGMAYHDRLFAVKGARLTDAELRAIAAELKLDLVRWERDRSSAAVAADVTAQDKACVGAGAAGTPAFFVNGRYVSGAQSFDRMRPLIEQELSKARKAILAGAPRAGIYAHMLALAGVKEKGPLDDLDKRVVRIDVAGSAAFGPKDAPVQLVIFTDFQCPYCSRTADRVREARAKLPKALRVVIKHFPLTSIHARARPAALAAVAAGLQGQFEAYHDTLFANRKKLSDEDLRAYAKALKLDLPRFERDRASVEVAKRVSDDIHEGRRIGVGGTPTAFLNGRKVGRILHDSAALVDAVRALKKGP